MASDNIGGAGALAMIYGPPIVGAVGGALIAGKGHRLVGGGIGLAVGIGAIFAFAKFAAANPGPLPWTTQVTTLKHGTPYALTLPAGGDPTAIATADGFADFGNNSGTVVGTWNGADGAPVPANIIAKQ
jgi:hypothetical protein